VQGVDDAWCTTWGLTREQAVGQTLCTIAGPHSSNTKVGALLDEATRGGKVGLAAWLDCGEARNLSATKVYVRHHLIIGPVRDSSGDVKSLVGVSRLLTPVPEAERVAKPLPEAHAAPWMQAAQEASVLGACGANVDASASDEETPLFAIIAQDQAAVAALVSSFQLPWSRKASHARFRPAPLVSRGAGTREVQAEDPPEAQPTAQRPLRPTDAPALARRNGHFTASALIVPSTMAAMHGHVQQQDHSPADDRGAGEALGAATRATHSPAEARAPNAPGSRMVWRTVEGQASSVECAPPRADSPLVVAVPSTDVDDVLDLRAIGQVRDSPTPRRAQPNARRPRHSDAARQFRDKMEVSVALTTLGSVSIFTSLVAASCVGFSCNVERLVPVERAAAFVAGAALVAGGVGCVPSIRSGYNPTPAVAMLITNAVSASANALLALVGTPVVTEPLSGARLYMVRWAECGCLAFLMTTVTGALRPGVVARPQLLGLLLAFAAMCSYALPILSTTWAPSAYTAFLFATYAPRNPRRVLADEDAVSAERAVLMHVLLCGSAVLAAVAGEHCITTMLQVAVGAGTISPQSQFVADCVVDVTAKLLFTASAARLGTPHRHAERGNSANDGSATAAAHRTGSGTATGGTAPDVPSLSPLASSELRHRRPRRTQNES